MNQIHNMDCMVLIYNQCYLASLLVLLCLLGNTRFPLDDALVYIIFLAAIFSNDITLLLIAIFINGLTGAN